MQVGVLALKPARFETRAHDVEELVELEGLGDEVRGPELDGLDRVLDRPVAGDDDGHDARIAGDGSVDDRSSVDTGESEVRHDHVEGKAVQRLDRGLARGRLDYVKPGIREALRQDTPQRLLIVYKEKMAFRIRHLEATFAAPFRWSMLISVNTLAACRRCVKSCTTNLGVAQLIPACQPPIRRLWRQEKWNVKL